MTDFLQFRLTFPRFDFNQTCSFGSGLHVIYGESGTGKSAFINQILGESKQTVNFTMSTISSPNDIQKVFQNPDTQIVSSSVAGELAFSLECKSRNTYEIFDQITELKKELIFECRDQRHPATLSGGEKESLNISTAFSVSPKCVLIDDGLSFLNEHSKEKMLSLIHDKINSMGCIVIWLTSDINDLEYGQTAWELSLSSLKKWDGKTNPFPDLKNQYGESNIKLNCNQLSFSYPDESAVFNSLNCEMTHFSVLGISGSNGSGKTTFAKILLDIEKPTAGDMQISKDDQPVSMAYLEQFPEKMIGADSIELFIDQLIHAKKLDPLKINQAINNLKSCQIDWDQIKDKTALELPWSTLRLILTIWLLNCEYDLVILDEPTFGLGRKQVINLAHYLQLYLKNKQLIIISHDKEFIHSFCDQILDLDQHQLITEPLKTILNEKN